MFIKCLKSYYKSTGFTVSYLHQNLFDLILFILTRLETILYYYQLYQLGTGGRSQKDLACTRCLPKAIGA